MEAIIKYRVYELNSVLGSSKHKALEEVSFNVWAVNDFDTEEEAIQALINDKKTYEEYLILKTVYITS